MSKSPVQRLGFWEKLDLYNHRQSLEKGSMTAMQWIIFHSQYEGKRDPLRYYCALADVLEVSRELGFGKINQDAIAATQVIESELDRQGHVFAAMDAHKRIFRMTNNTSYPV